MTAPTWGRLSRGVTWHLIPAHYVVTGSWPSTWCGKDESLTELLEGMPPSGGRPCRRCCREVTEMARMVDLARQRGELIDMQPHLADQPAPDARPVEDVDLVGALINHNTPTKESA